MNVVVAAARPALMRRVVGRARAVSRFARLSAVGATVVVPLLGAVTARSPVTAGDAIGLVVVALAFHLYGYILNDVIDFPIDRTDPRRQQAPLVAGSIGRRTALAIGLANVPIAIVALRSVDDAAGTQAALVLAIGATAAYDLLGKRLAHAVVADLVQAIAWAALCGCGALAIGTVTSSTVWLMTFFVVYILMANGVHGGLRDIANDVRHGARTTPILLGAEPLPGGGVRLGTRVTRYATALQWMLTIVSGGLLLSLDLEPGALVATALWWALGSALAFGLLHSAIAASDVRARIMVLGALHLIMVIGVVAGVLAPVMPTALLALAITFYATPLLTYGWLLDAIRRRPDRRDPR
jgi:4-hydroxybenzoate polyprenyltransferase